MAKQRRPVHPAFQADDDDDASARPTSLEHKPVPPQPASPVTEPITDKRPPVVLPDQTIRPTAVAGHRPSPTVRRFRLVGATTFECATGACDIGSHPLNALVLADPSVSRFHCEVRLENQRALVRDLGSTNGTVVEGVRVREAWLKTGDRLALGNVTLRFELDEATVERPVSTAAAFGALIGDSAVMRSCFHALEVLAKTNTSCLIVGERGTGKSCAAEALHQARARGEATLVQVDCELPPVQLELELFGDRKKPPRLLSAFEDARGGTVLLRDVGELPLEVQARLVRALDDLPKGTRLISTSSRDLRPDVNAGRFRSDLYARLALGRVVMPPLREHGEDIPSLATELLHQLGATAESAPTLFTSDFFGRLVASNWSANVTELRHFLARCLAFERTEDTHATVPGPPHAPTARLSLEEARAEAAEQFERQYLGHLLARHGGKLAPAAAEAKLDRATLAALLRKHAIPSKA